MSYRIEYQWAALRTTVAGEARFVIAVEGGDNNIGDARRAARRWEACMIGSARQVLKQAVGFAASCESEMLRPLGRRCSAEAYIRRIRCLVESVNGGQKARLFGGDCAVFVSEGSFLWITARGAAVVENRR